MKRYHAWVYDRNGATNTWLRDDRGWVKEWIELGINLTVGLGTVFGVIAAIAVMVSCVW